MRSYLRCPTKCCSGRAARGQVIDIRFAGGVLPAADHGVGQQKRQPGPEDSAAMSLSAGGVMIWGSTVDG